MWFSQAPLCRYRFKFIFEDIIFLFSGNIIEYICFWRFNSIIMTWNKWLVFTISVIMGLNNISPWPCPLGFICLPCVITWLYWTPWLFMRSVGVVVMSLASHGEGPWFETHTLLYSISYYAPGLKGPPGASSNWIVRPFVCPSVRLSVCLSVRR